jgi:hypothetical protein
MVLRAPCIRTRYVDIPLTYRLHCRLKTRERPVAICCPNNGASSFAQLFALSSLVVLNSRGVTAFAANADAIFLVSQVLAPS